MDIIKIILEIYVYYNVIQVCILIHYLISGNVYHVHPHAPHVHHYKPVKHVHLVITYTIEPAY